MIRIDQDFKNLIPPLNDEEFKQLESNLLKEGWRDSERIILWNDTIVDGHNRFNICEKHNIAFKTVKMNFGSKDEAFLWIIDNQLGRRNINTFCRVELVLRKEDYLKKIAKHNQVVRKGNQAGTTVQISAQLLPMKVREELAKAAKTSHDTIAKVKYIINNSDEITKNNLRKDVEKLTINKVYTNLVKKEQRERIIEEFKEAPKLDENKKKYSIIYADPPWKYYAGGNKNQSLHYKGMEINEIKNLKVADLADKNCILFLWVTFPILKEAFEVIESWGFEYSTCGFVWVKRNKKSEGWFFGLGNWTRSNAELCLIATKGSILRNSASISQIIDTPVEEHSKKPDIVRNKIVELVGDLPRIELFSRQKVEGWDNWGNEIGK